MGLCLNNDGEGVVCWMSAFFGVSCPCDVKNEENKNKEANKKHQTHFCEKTCQVLCGFPQESRIQKNSHVESQCWSCDLNKWIFHPIKSLCMDTRDSMT